MCFFHIVRSTFYNFKEIKEQILFFINTTEKGSQIFRNRNGLGL